MIGAGFSGLNMGYRLKDEGIPFRIIEKSDRVGGVWNWSRYPVAAVDV